MGAARIHCVLRPQGITWGLSGAPLSHCCPGPLPPRLAGSPWQAPRAATVCFSAPCHLPGASRSCLGSHEILMNARACVQQPAALTDNSIKHDGCGGTGVIVPARGPQGEAAKKGPAKPDPGGTWREAGPREPECWVIFAAPNKKKGSHKSVCWVESRRLILHSGYEKQRTLYLMPGN